MCGFLCCSCGFGYTQFVCRKERCGKVVAAHVSLICLGVFPQTAKLMGFLPCVSECRPGFLDTGGESRQCPVVPVGGFLLFYCVRMFFIMLFEGLAVPGGIFL